jgi:hypothetical protein
MAPAVIATLFPITWAATWVTTSVDLSWHDRSLLLALRQADLGELVQGVDDGCKPLVQPSALLDGSGSPLLDGMREADTPVLHLDEPTRSANPMDVHQQRLRALASLAGRASPTHEQDLRRRRRQPREAARHKPLKIL